eukprot:COSAG06_NODE_20672_length_785_cov_46.064140_1_plen_86_part_10
MPESRRCWSIVDAGKWWLKISERGARAPTGRLCGRDGVLQLLHQRRCVHVECPTQHSGVARVEAPRRGTRRAVARVAVLPPGSADV